jgi:hypothetical protein
VAPLRSANVPLEQGRHELPVAPPEVAEKVPGAQFVQPEAPVVALNVPALQLMQLTAPPAE